MPEIIGDFSHLEEKLPTSSAWQLDPVGVADVDEVVDNRLDFQRRNSSDNLFEIVPQCIIRRCDDGRGAGDQLSNIGLVRFIKSNCLNDFWTFADLEPGQNSFYCWRKRYSGNCS
jgi:hypothetical protein